jgi:hypothetical protein
MINIIDKVKLVLKDDDIHDKNSFWPTDCEKDKFEIFHRWMGTPPTNPIEPEKMIIFSAGKMIELALIERLRKLGIILLPKEKDDEQLAFMIDRHNVPVSGRIDAVALDDANKSMILEIKTFYGDYQARELRAGNPRTSYLKQMAVYMDAAGLKKGVLLYFDRGTGEMFQFILLQKENLDFECVTYKPEDVMGKFPQVIQFDIDDEYRRFAEIYKEYIEPDIEPESDFTYKIPLDQIDWSKISKDKISKARNNQAVIGSGWQVAYSPYKNLIVTKEAARYGKTFQEYIGYSDAELAQICEMTKGYTTWKK